MNSKTNEYDGSIAAEVVKKEFSAARSSFSALNLEDVFNEMIAAFLNEKDLLFHQLRLAAKEKNTQSLARAAHRIKGSVLALGLNSVASVVLEIERQSLSPETDWTTVLKLMEQLNVACEHFALLTQKNSSARPTDAALDEKP
jgi:HPt (histidine-containing phosphotransfer) domain-containing protein